MRSSNDRIPRRFDSTGSNRSMGSRGGGRSRRVDTSRFPIEQGIICTLKDSFGFIHCAERPAEIFFHYSEVANCHPDDLQIDTEVEFRVGSSSSDDSKLAAYEVNAVPTGTVVWEIEEQPEKFFQGLVERSAYEGRGNSKNGSNEGTIRVLDENKEDTSSGPLVRFRLDDYNIDKNQKSSRLFRGDLVEFRVLVDRRTKQKYARYITMLQTEKERKRIEREIKMLENATEEEGVVISLNKGFGFIKSNRRREHVYFHYSHLILPDDDEGKDFELKKGQELKFLVVTERKDGEDKCAARKVTCLPKGSVIFQKIVAKGVKGKLTLCPRPPSSGNAGYADNKNGRIHLLEPILDLDEGGENAVDEVSLEYSDAPGGGYTFQQRGASVHGLWIEEGDTLLFDVVKELADGSYRAVPTLHTLEIGGEVKPPIDDQDKSSAVVRLVALSLVGRAEGTMHSLKVQSGYGFIHYAERPIDIHFNTYNLIPEELQSDLRKSLGVDGKAVKLEVGAGVQFDICAHGTVSSGISRGRGRGAHERENVKGHRVLLLPASCVTTDREIATGVKGVVKSIVTKQLYAGVLDLECELNPMTLEERHPLVAQMISSYLEESENSLGQNPLVYRDVLSMKEDDVVVQIVEKMSNGALTCDHIPVPGLVAHPGRLCIRRIKEEGSNENDDEEKGKPSPSKKKQTNPNENIRFDKSNFCPESKEDVPPNAGDVVTCDIAQSRRTGKFIVRNLKVIERKELDADAEELESTEASGIGIVKDVVQKSNFGFISVFDEKATKRELLFFHLSEGGKKARKNTSLAFKKGDEVKFDIGVEKSGKRVAANVRVIPKGTIPSKPSKDACRGFVLLVPSHTSLADTPVRKQNHAAVPSEGSEKPGRWGNVKGDTQGRQHADIHEVGSILLLEDKTGMFKKARRNRKRGTSIGSNDDDTRSLGSFDDSRSIDSIDDISVEDIETAAANGYGTLLTHLPYKNGAIAINGMGSSSTMDSSSNPRRGDLVSFIRTRRGGGVRDIRIVTRQAATIIRGRLESIEILLPGENAGKAKFIAASEKEEQYGVDLKELVGCDAGILKENEPVEGILHEGKIYGVCRTKDISLSSKLGTSHKERPKLNLFVKKNRGGKIIAQSMMAKVSRIC